MKFKYLNTALAGIILATSCLVNVANAGLITYTDSTNTWVYSDFLNTGVDDYTRTGSGVLANDGGTLIGGGSHFLWNSGLRGGGVATHDWSSYTDYYFPGGYQIEVIGAKWTNIDVRSQGNQGEGIFGYQHEGNTRLVGAPIADGTVLDGVFTLDNSGANATWSYTENSTSQIPEPSTIVIFALGVLGLASRRFKK